MRRRQIRPIDLPPLWHWLYFLPTTLRASIGPDGHVLNQEWGDPPLRRGDKQGRSGHFQVVTAEYQYFQNGALCVREERDIVYLQGPAPAQPARRDEFGVKTAAADPCSLTVTPDPVMLMGYSAMTFNSHLIHFDQLYTQREEGYPEREVHGPLVAVILARLLIIISKRHRAERGASSGLISRLYRDHGQGAGAERST